MLNIFVGAFFLIQWKTDSGARLCILHVPVFEYKVLSVIVYKVCSYVVVVFILLMHLSLYNKIYTHTHTQLYIETENKMITDLSHKNVF